MTHHWVPWWCRALLRVLNAVLAVCGLAIVGYSIYVFGEWNRNGAIKSSTPWCGWLPRHM